MSTTVPWAPIALLVMVLLVVARTAVVEARARRARRTSYWRGAGW